ncbi:MAG: hypothetical protein GY869_01155 [Planctomycetes bacterium]|nr:hypothetical protein [Planctomycetota bacterium]
MPNRIVTGYSILTLLWWRSLCPERRFMFNQRILWLTLVILPGYALIDEGISMIRQRGFSWNDFLYGIGGIFLGVLCAVAFSKHHLVNAESETIESKTSSKNCKSS